MPKTQQDQLSVEDSRLLGAMLEDPIGWHYGLGLSEAAGIASGTAYPVLARLERSGLLESRWDVRRGDAPRRRVYRLTGLGERAALAAQADTDGERRRRRRPALGALKGRLA